MRDPRICSSAQRAELWKQWRRGVPFWTIAKCIKLDTGTLWDELAATGGISPRPRKRRDCHLTMDDREVISRALACDLGVRAIARALDRPPSTVLREIERNGGRANYRATTAEERALATAKRPKRCKLAMYPELGRLVAKRLRKNWSPQQIAGSLRVSHSSEPTMQVSHETIYKTLFIQARGVLKSELCKHLRQPHSLRRPPKPKEGRSTIRDAVSIRKRPAEVEDRAVPGHWEGDLLAGDRRSHIATLVERTTRYTILVKVKNTETATVVAALVEAVKRMPEELRKSLTWDRGHELADHANFTIATDMQVFFCDPYCPWQRGTNENTNGLLRQYFPKGHSVARVSQGQLDRISAELNERPRKTLGFKTPVEEFTALLR